MGCAKVCGWILGCIGCCCCTIVLGFILVNLGVFGGIYFLVRTALSCNATELAMAEKCNIIGYEVTNLTAKNPTIGFGFDYNNKEISKVCKKYNACQKDHFCFQNTDKIGAVVRTCVIREFLADKFSTCRTKLIDIAKLQDDSNCLNFLIDEKTRCEKWDENRNCLLRAIKYICGEGIYDVIIHQERFFNC